MFESPEEQNFVPTPVKNGEDNLLNRSLLILPTGELPHIIFVLFVITDNFLCGSPLIAPIDDLPHILFVIFVILDNLLHWSPLIAPIDNLPHIFFHELVILDNLHGSRLIVLISDPHYISIGFIAPS